MIKQSSKDPWTSKKGNDQHATQQSYVAYEYRTQESAGANRQAAHSLADMAGSKQPQTEGQAEQGSSPQDDPVRIELEPARLVQMLDDLERRSPGARQLQRRAPVPEPPPPPYHTCVQPPHDQSPTLAGRLRPSYPIPECAGDALPGLEEDACYSTRETTKAAHKERAWPATS